MEDIKDPIVKKRPGRPFKSKIRERMVEILYNIKKAHGYEILKIYKVVYGNCAMKSIYYNLSRGADLNEFELVSSERKEGDFSWGGSVLHNYYKLGSAAKPKYDNRISIEIQKYLDLMKRKKTLKRII